jgi:hypothetical protein
MTHKHNSSSLKRSASLAVVLAIAATALQNSAAGSTPAAAQFVKTDTTTQGSWHGVYGADGANVVNNRASYPSYATVTHSGATGMTWTSYTNDPRALQKVGTAPGRIAAAWNSDTSFTIDLNLTDGNSHQVALYCLDWNAQGRTQRIDILDAASETLLDSRTVASFSQTPQYLVWNLQGNVQIKVTQTAGSSAVISGIFFGTAPAAPVSIGVAPATASLTGGQSASFKASVSGSSNTAATWSINPAIGTINNGVYQAPAIIPSQQAVTVTATSAADPTKTASATVSLIPVGITVGPSSVSLNVGASATFAASVTGTNNTAVTWSLSPAVGTINNGVYQAPASIATQQLITVMATSAADPTKIASATVSLIPVGITVGPSSVSLNAGASAAFSASVTGSSNTAVTWSINPAVGSIANGVYTAPATIGNVQAVTLTAASVADLTKTATAAITLTPSVTTITLPLEVLGANGTTASASVTIPSGANLSGQITLWMQIHGLRSDTQASVQVNNSAWLPISNSTVTLAGNAMAYGGIGGGFSTLKITMNLPTGTVQTGTNTVSFRFNQTDGRVSGFRVLAFNIQAADGTLLIPASTFVNDDPNYWQPPSTQASDIAAGQSLWHSAPLTIPVLTGGTAPILAHCSDCHTADGMDLKYFNYSNNSIQARSVFHGLTPQQGNQIASYIRSLNVPNPGRPWNPPYQPGPGLDEQPVSNWAAGAGLSAVLDTDQEMVNAIFPAGFQPSVFAATSRLNQRELPLPLQLPDWNQWLPGTHPMDAFGATFTSSGYNTFYQTLSSSLQVGNASVYVAQTGNFNNWFVAFYGLYNQITTPLVTTPALWTPSTVDAVYSLAQWGLVKNFELMNEFQLQDLAPSMFGPQSDPRSWYSNLPFFVAPHELKMPTSGVAGLRNGSQAEYVYLSYIWYNLQLILDDSNGFYSYQFPIDWPYVDGFVKAMGELVPSQAGIQTMWLIKGLEVENQNGQGPQAAGNGWEPNVSQLSLLVTPEWNSGVWTNVDPVTRAAVANGVVQSWLQQASQFTPQQYYAGGWTTATAVPVPGGNAYDAVFPDWVWYTIPRFLLVGGDLTLATQLAQWAQTIWPNANWTADLNATCTWGNDPNYLIISCSQ